MKEIRRLFWTVGGIKGRCLVFAVTFFALLIYLTSFTFAWEPNRMCDKGSDCDGLAPSGSCGAQGFFCIDDHSCSSYWIGNNYTNPSGCEWEFYAYCFPACFMECDMFTLEYISADCDADCVFVFYNQCECMCGGLGEGYQAGQHESCKSRVTCM